jgi:hypothetical protein
MKSVTISIAFILLIAVVNAQDITPAAKGVTYGEATTDDSAIAVTAMEENMANGKFTGKTTGKVVSVCQEKGCWMKLERSGGEPIMVKFKDYGFFMPKDIVGKEVVLNGEATVKETSVKQLKHYAKDAGKTEEEIKKIKQAKKELIFVAKGVLVL